VRLRATEALRDEVIGRLQFSNLINGQSVGLAVINNVRGLGMPQPTRSLQSLIANSVFLPKGISMRRIEEFLGRLAEIAWVVVGIYGLFMYFKVVIKMLIPNRDDDIHSRALRSFAWVLLIASIIFFTGGPFADHRSPEEKAKAAQLEEDENLVGWSLSPNASHEETANFYRQVAITKEARRVGHY
jgi:hypothetical protein